MNSKDLRRKRKKTLSLLKQINDLKWQVIDSCNICGNQNTILLTTKDRYGLKLRSVYCTNCGLVFLKDRLTKESYFNFYSTGIYRKLVSAFNERIIDNSNIYQQQYVFAHNIIKSCEHFLKEKQGGSILDIGGSTGNVAFTIADTYQLKPAIIDPAVDELNFNSRKDVVLINALIEDINPSSFQKFDIVLMYQTIDHLFDLNKTLQNIYNLMQDDGYFIFDIVDFYQCCRNGYPEEYIKIDHCYYLSDQSINLIINRFGFEILSKDYCTNPFHITYICRKSSSKLKRIEYPAPDKEVELFLLNRITDFSLRKEQLSTKEQIIRSLYQLKKKLYAN